MGNKMVPHITVKMIDPLLNVSFIARFLDPEFLAKNKSRPFSEGVYELFPTLRGKIEDTMTRNEIYNIVEPIVLRELSLRHEELNQRFMRSTISYFMKNGSRCMDSQKVLSRCIRKLYGFWKN
ncbi:hypothetical protein [Lachnoclostridium phytofermentans]|uniref:Uncharacterized protein n=1 Tax=Lachnoclostridium phytofermentans (strain ATCC 700394 / DSM 18823 / ISDg) TaxID=357809 RepID=A9KLP4_LACP7|nr:hypothetical protein [Lachnoclostridium phytofermentans]ABX42788.1 hypothetical protein Cphy_2427 [Lachnoclostridium phytofermentans ISDg]